MDEKTCEIFNIFSLLRKLNGLNKQRVESFGLNNLESIILFHIDKIDNLTQKDLVNKLQIPKQTVNSKILNLKENDLITMQGSTSDKRIKTLVLTKKGEDEVRKINEALSLSNQKIYDDLGEESIQSIKENLNQLIVTLEKNINEEVI
ncbi:winged helix-turn-helix transcriptional regulator [Anaerococcus sp. mt242]|uniref:MarR family winged helix-turn-helix transcriptional regulator n=1 Tax=Anaerococcus sp. mt242 TaxID=2661917 RepID=UPI0019328474|nr:MarR family winged helix-turn-helix transcriptional regulator [Anaerococcus sp. mt242]MBM0047085.1 winged helix-turn-helix transcriptional regulator [Anaerococcus sp. mt242]